MRFLFLLLTLLIYISASSQSPTMAGMAANMEQTINNQISNIQQQLTNAKANNAPPKQIKELEQKLETMKIAQKAISQYTPRKTKPQPKGPPGSTWTGYLSAVKKGSATFPPHKREAYIDLYFNEAIPTLHRIYNENEELKFQDDKGIGSLKDHSEVMYGTEWLICDCNTVGEAELHEVVVNKIAGTYDIQATAPGCDDGGGSCGMTWDISIPDEPLKNPNVLSGTRTYKIEGAGQSSTVVTMTWYLVRESNVELIVKPIDYNKWLPEPGKDEQTVAQNKLSVDVFLQGKNGKPLNHMAKKFLIRLENTSREPGITINYPVNPISPAEPDLKLLEQPNAIVDDDGQQMEIECDGCTKANFKIGSFDGGGYATLKVIATLDDESVVAGHLFTSTGTTEVTIPKRNGSMIAESWLKDHGNPGDYDDQEISDGNKNNGDGLTAYEEYRGVISAAKFAKSNPNNFGRLDPQKKELGVKITEKDFAVLSEGIKLFESASRLQIVRFKPSEIGDDRRLNKNYRSGHDFDQFVLFLETGNLRLQNNSGHSYGIYDIFDDIPPGTPTNTKKIIIDVEGAKGNYRNWNAAQPLPFTELEKIEKVVAHELGHSVGMWHHGDLPEEPSPQIATAANKYRVFAQNGFEITKRPFPIEDAIGIPGGLQSGDLSCIMAYNPYYSWSHRVGPDALDYFFEVPAIRIGKNFCNSSKGTGINSEKFASNNIPLSSNSSPLMIHEFNKFFGDATNGNCLSQIKLKD